MSKLTPQSQENLNVAHSVEIERATTNDYLAAVVGETGRRGYLHSVEEGIMSFSTVAAAIDFIGKNRHGKFPLVVIKPPEVAKPAQAKQGRKR